MWTKVTLDLVQIRKITLDFSPSTQHRGSRSVFPSKSDGAAAFKLHYSSPKSLLEKQWAADSHSQRLSVKGKAHLPVIVPPTIHIQNSNSKTKTENGVQRLFLKYKKSQIYNKKIKQQYINHNLVSASNKFSTTKRWIIQRMEKWRQRRPCF